MTLAPVPVNFFLTNAGKAKWLTEQTAGRSIQPTEVRFGSGYSGTPLTQTALVTPLTPPRTLALSSALRTEANILYSIVDQDLTAVYQATEAGLFDAAGVLISYYSVDSGDVFNKRAGEFAGMFVPMAPEASLSLTSVDISIVPVQGATNGVGGIVRLATPAEQGTFPAPSGPIVPSLDALENGIYTGHLRDDAVTGDKVAPRAIGCYHLGGGVQADTFVIANNSGPAITASLNNPTLARARSVENGPGLVIEDTYRDFQEPVLIIENVPAGRRDNADPPGEECAIVRGLVTAIRLQADGGTAIPPNTRLYLKDGNYNTAAYPFTTSYTTKPVGWVLYGTAPSGTNTHYAIYLDLWAHLTRPYVTISTAAPTTTVGFNEGDEWHQYSA